MSRSSFSHSVRLAFAPPSYLAEPAFGIDISTSGIKIARITEESYGLTLKEAGEQRFELGVFVGGEMSNREAVANALTEIRKRYGIRYAHVALPESRAYLFETDAEGASSNEIRSSIERRIDEFVPIPPGDVAFDFVQIGEQAGKPHVIGVGYARRAIEELLVVLDEAKIEALSLESETFAVPRALVPQGSHEATLIIDIGRTTTKLMIAIGNIPRFATTLDIGGHALTLAVQKHFGVTEEDAKRVKAEKGIVVTEGGEEYLAAMLSTVSVIREEILKRLDYWQTHTTNEELRVTRAILAGGNATIRGLPEYLESTLGIPVSQGDVFSNFASRDFWLPPVNYQTSLAYATSIGLALRNFEI
jgi:type IV pilus assembly protein PilM